LPQSGYMFPTLSPRLAWTSDNGRYGNLMAPQHTNGNPRVQKYPPVSAM
jgi:hypothetical protein